MSLIQIREHMQMISAIHTAPVARYSSLAQYAAPAASGSGSQDSFVSRYADNVKANFKDDGVGGTLLASGVHGLIGGILGGIGGSLVGAVLPAPIGPALATTCQVAGALGGFLYRLGERD